MITARFAGEQGRTVLAVPGRIDVATSAGCHQLLRDGAALLGGVEDILAELSYGDRLPAGFATAVAAPSRAHQRAEGPADGTTPEERVVLDCFRGGAILGADLLAVRTRLGAGPLAAVLRTLELEGRLAKQLDGRYEAIAD